MQRVRQRDVDAPRSRDRRAARRTSRRPPGFPLRARTRRRVRVAARDRAQLDLRRGVRAGDHEPVDVRRRDDPPANGFHGVAHPQLLPAYAPSLDRIGDRGYAVSSPRADRGRDRCGEAASRRDARRRGHRADPGGARHDRGRGLRALPARGNGARGRRVREHRSLLREDLVLFPRQTAPSIGIRRSTARPARRRRSAAAPGWSTSTWTATPPRRLRHGSLQRMGGVHRLARDRARPRRAVHDPARQPALVPGWRRGRNRQRVLVHEPDELDVWTDPLIRRATVVS